MRNIQRRLPLLLLVSLINLIAFIRQMTLGANDLLYHEGTQKVYASVPSSDGGTGNSIAEIDPVQGSVTNQTFVGSEPNVLAQADDGATLYVGLDGAQSIRSYNILTHTAGPQFFLGRDSFFGPYSYSDIAVSPGNPSVVAVARQYVGLGPSEAGVAIFDNGVRRTNTGPGHLDGSDTLAFASSSLLYGSGPHGLTKFTVVPGSPQSLVLSRGFNGVGVFDNGVQRPNVVNESTAIEFGANSSILYAPSSTDLLKFLVDANGVTRSTTTVQFNSATASVNEGAGFVKVTVTRIGDTSRPALVLSSTADTAGLQSCAIANGKASERCDYGTVAGRLQFGIGETTKTFTIPIVDDALVEGDETLTVSLSAVVGVNLATPSVATITIVDNDTTPAPQNPIDGVTPFITQQYIDFLGRLPDPIGLENWRLTLAPCPNGGFGEFDHPECDRVHVSAGFFLSEEFRGRGYFAYKFYEVGFDRRPTYAEFGPDMAIVGGAQSPQLEIISKQIYTIAFVERQEFTNRYDALSNSAYVDALESNAEVTLTNKAALVAALDGNQKTRGQVLREIVELQSVTDKFFIRAFVAMQYFGYLRRDPDTIGYDNWVTTLTADPSNFRHMIFGFIYSDEYRHRFGP